MTSRRAVPGYLERGSLFPAGLLGSAVYFLVLFFAGIWPIRQSNFVGFISTEVGGTTVIFEAVWALAVTVFGGVWAVSRLKHYEHYRPSAGTVESFSKRDENWSNPQPFREWLTRWCVKAAVCGFLASVPTVLHWMF